MRSQANVPGGIGAKTRRDRDRAAVDGDPPFWAWFSFAAVLNVAIWRMKA